MGIFRRMGDPNGRIVLDSERMSVVITSSDHLFKTLGFGGGEIAEINCYGGEEDLILDRPLFFKDRHQASRPRVLFLENAPAETL
jgi:hypothetical protein